MSNEPTRSFQIISGFYYDCPSCDGYASDPEDITVDRIIGVDNIKTWVEHHCESNKPFFLYEILEYGNMEKVCEFKVKTGHHRVKEVSFTLDGEDYIYLQDPKGHKMMWASAAYRTLFAKDTSKT